MNKPTANQIDVWDWVLRIGLAVAASFLAWNTSVLIELQKGQAALDKRTAIIESTQYSPSDRLEDLRAEMQRYDILTKRMAEVGGDIKEIKAVLLRIEGDR